MDRIVNNSLLKEVLEEVHCKKLSEIALTSYNIAPEELAMEEDKVVDKLIAMLYQGAQEDAKRLGDAGDGKGWLCISAHFPRDGPDDQGYDVTFGTFANSRLHRDALEEAEGRVIGYELLTVPGFKLITPGWMGMFERINKRL